MFNQAWTIARNTFTESIRQPIYLVLVGCVLALLVLGLTWSRYTFDDDTQLMLRTGLFMIFTGGLLLATFTASTVLAREIHNKTVLTVVSKPIGRPIFVVGKFLGVSTAVALAVWIWSLALLMLARHQVISSAAQPVDWPVLWALILSGLIAFVFAVWCNYFYNWVFVSQQVLALGVTMTLAFVFVLMVNRDWAFQPLATEFYNEDRPFGQVLIALMLVMQGLVVVCAIATACATRLPLVVTLGVCWGVYLVGGASDYFFGQHVEQAPAYWAGYAVAPNLQYFFLADALVQKHTITSKYVLLTSGYAAFYTAAVLCLATALFQTRETG